MTYKNINIIGVLLLVAVIVFTVIGIDKQTAIGSSPPGAAAVVGTSTNVVSVAGTAQLLFATSTNCTSRVIGTQSEVKLTFSDRTGARPTGANGHIQAASSTVVYDGGLYGCSAVWVYPYGADTISITEAY